MRIKEWNKLEYHDSRQVLIRLRELQEQIATSDLPQKVTNLRTKALRNFLEGRQAALFCYGIGSAVIKTPVYRAISEARDYDCVALWKKDGEQAFTPIQLKELVPEALNSKTNLVKELEKLKKYASSKDLVIALHMNRAGRLEFSEIQLPAMKVAEVGFMVDYPLIKVGGFYMATCLKTLSTMNSYIQQSNHRPQWTLAIARPTGPSRSPEVTI